jgi:hypothetical protein
VSAAVTILAFACYYASLLPGLDFGDTAAYQSVVGEWRTSPRQAYPLYFAIANIAFALVGGEPARALNLVSAAAGALACGATVWLGTSLTRSLLAGLVSGLFLLGSYTFWSQAVIGEVYSLHLLIVSVVLIAAIHFAQAPSLPRLALVLGLYAAGFGNHLMMILLAPALLAILALAPGGARLLWSRHGALIGALCALAGASQYLWNAAYLWQVVDPPPSFREGLATFWFDVTKSDWRSSMVMGVHESALKHRLGLYWFDLRQQVGPPGIVLAVLGLLALASVWRNAVMVIVGYLTALTFAYTYNVGDVHVFFLPSHHFVTLAAGAGTAALAGLIAAHVKRHVRAASALLLVGAIAYPAWRILDTFPAVDRSADQRPRQWLDALTSGLGPESLLLADLNWQLDNGLDYYVRHTRPELNVVRASPRVLSLPQLVYDNFDGCRSVLATPLARDLLRTAYGDLFAFQSDARAPRQSLIERLGELPGGTVFVLALLAPYRDLPFDTGELDAAARRLTGGTATLAPGASYQVLAGRAGQAPALTSKADTPFRHSISVGGYEIDVRMESWLPADTIRRAGFGHVVVDGHHALTLERGVSALVMRPDGSTTIAYASGLFAPIGREFVLAGAGMPTGRDMLGNGCLAPASSSVRLPSRRRLRLRRPRRGSRATPRRSRRRCSSGTNESATSAPTSRTSTPAVCSAERPSSGARSSSASPAGCVGRTPRPSERSSCPTA